MLTSAKIDGSMLPAPNGRPAPGGHEWGDRRKDCSGQLLPTR
jgi:hypothetical protein